MICGRQSLIDPRRTVTASALRSCLALPSPDGAPPPGSVPLDAACLSGQEATADLGIPLSLL